MATGNSIPLIHIQPTSGDEDSIEAAREFSTEFGTPDWDLVKQYLQYGGAQNFYQLLVHPAASIARRGGKAATPPALAG